MSIKEQPVVFFGTPEIAAYVLERLISEKFNIAAVVTSPDKPAGRGRKIRESEVKHVAVENNLRVLQPESLKDAKFINELKKIAPAIQVVVAFRMLPKDVWQIPSHGTINMHASLLPNYRGAAPINWVIINGENETGVTTFIIDDKIDTGQILLKEKINIEPQETAGSLHDKIKYTGAGLVIKTLEGLLGQSLSPVSQNLLEKEYKYLRKAPKINKEDCRIDWNDSCIRIANMIRGLSPVPGAYTEISLIDKPVYIKVFYAEAQKNNHNYPVASILSDNKSYLKIAAADGFIEIKELQLAGKKRTSDKEFLKGHKVKSVKSG